MGDPLLTRDRLLLLELATPEQVEQIQHRALQINQYLSVSSTDAALPGRLQTGVWLGL